MRPMRAFAIRAALAAAILVVACNDEPAGPDGTGSLAIVIVPESGPAAVVAAAPESPEQVAAPEGRSATGTHAARIDDVTESVGDVAQAPEVRFNVAGHLTGARYRLTGPTNRSGTLSATATGFEGEITGLQAGTYIVEVEGLVGSDVDHYGKATGVGVTAGQTATANVTIASFVPPVANIASPTKALTFVVNITAVTAAESYEIQLDDDPAFPSPTSQETTSLSVTLGPVPAPGTYHVRVRAKSAAVTSGRWSDTKSVTVEADATPSDPASPNPLGFLTGGGVQMLTDLNILPAGDQDWWSISACRGDTVVATVTPITSGFNWTTGIQRSGTQLASVTGGVLEYVLPLSGTYALGVGGASGSIGQYELALEVKAGSSANLGASDCSLESPFRVVVTPSGQQIANVGGTATFSAEAQDSVGQAIPGKTVTWTTLNTAIATVDGASGQATGAGAGQTSVVADVEGVKGYGVVTVADPAAAAVNLWGANTPAGALLTEIWGTSPLNAWAVGEGGLILRWNGTSWSSVTSPTAQNLNGIWGSSASDVFAVGDNGTIIRYNGTSWSSMTSNTTQNLRAVWGSSPQNVYAVGADGTIMRYDGTQWSAVTSPTTALLIGIFGFARDDIFAVGTAGTILRYNGTSWSTMTSPVGVALSGVWGPAPNNVFAVGLGGTILNYNGSAWSMMTSPTTATLRRIAASSNNEMYAIGDSGRVIRYNGTAWSLVTPKPTSSALYGAWAAPGGGVHVVGAGGGALRGYRGGSVAVTPGAQTLDAINRTLALSAEARDAGNTTITGYTFTYQWSTSDGGIAGVNPTTGLVTAVGGGGPATVSAQASGGASGSSSITVNPSFTGTMSASSAGFADQITLTPGTGITWTGSETVTIGGELPYIESQSASSIVLRVPSVPTGDAEVEIGNQGAGGLIQYDTLSITSLFVRNWDPEAAAVINANLPPSDTSFFISLADSSWWHFLTLYRPNSSLMRVEMDWQTTADLDVWWLDSLGSVSVGNNDGATFLNNPEITTEILPADSTWRLYFEKYDTETPQTVARVLLSGTTVGNAVAAGGGHSCALNVDGRAWCWGSNAFGQLGDNTFNASSTPVAVTGGLAFKSIATGWDHTCALTDDGEAWCWGANYEGQLGSTAVGFSPASLSGALPQSPDLSSSEDACFRHGRKDPRTCVGLSYPALGGGDGLATALGEAPTAVSGGLEFAQISTGGFHTCGITSAGEAWCWGMGWDGELGDGNFSSSATPVAVSGGMTFTYISAGLYHTCGIVTGGAAYCWGYGGDGQLGDNFVYGYAGTPVAVQGALTFDAISAGAYHTCGLVAGAAYCWGGNYWGELGTGSFSTSAVPVAVTGGMTFRQVDAMFGIGVTCGITDMRFVYCWGNGGNGELGDGNSGSGYYSNAPVASLLATPASAVSLGGQHVCVADSFGTLVCWGYNQSGQLGNAEDGITPGALENPPVTLHRPAGGAYHNCALTSSTGTGTPYCWGYNGSGELGNNTTSFSPTYDPVVVFGSPSVSRLMGGGGTNSHQGAGGRTSCAIQSSGGRVVCWGYNFYGQIGDGTTVNKSVPTLTTSTLAFQQVVTGLYHTCGIASATSYAYCWGYNVFGQLGNNTTTNSSSPVQVSGTLQFVQLAVGLYHTCGVTTAGVMYCWGYNFYGQLGDNTSGSGTNKLVPNAVVNILGLTYTRVIATFYSTCGLASTGAAYCWGYNYYGQLGDGTSGSGTDQNDPVAVAGGLTFTALTGGIYHVCGLSSSAAYCWGYNGYSQLGDGTTIWRNQPVAAASAQSFASITSGWYHTCGQLTGGGAIYCWGRNFEGELGRRTFEDSPVPVSTGGAIIALSPGVAITGTNGAGSRKTLQLRPRQE